MVLINLYSCYDREAQTFAALVIVPIVSKVIYGDLQFDNGYTGENIEGAPEL